MKTKTLLIGGALIALFIGGCGENTSNDNVAVSAKAGMVECKERNKASFKSTTIDGSDFKIVSIHAEKHDMVSQNTQYPAINIIMTDFDSDGKSWKSPKGNQLKIFLSLTGISGEKMTSGEYPPFETSGFGVDRSSTFTIIKEGDFVGMWSSGGKSEANGTLTITHLSDTQICGSIDVQDTKGTSLTASFSVPLEIVAQH